MTLAFLITLGVFIIFAIGVGCGFSDAIWVIKKHIQGDRVIDDSLSNRERIYRALFGANLLVILCISFGIVALFGGLIILLAQY